MNVPVNAKLVAAATIGFISRYPFVSLKSAAAVEGI